MDYAESSTHRAARSAEGDNKFGDIHMAVFLSHCKVIFSGFDTVIVIAVTELTEMTTVINEYSPVCALSVPPT